MKMKKIFILTGEPSGDKLASSIIAKLKIQNPDIEYLFYFRFNHQPNHTPTNPHCAIVSTKYPVLSVSIHT